MLPQALKCIAVDVGTFGQLGTCTAVRVGEAITLLREFDLWETSAGKSAVEAELLRETYCRRSQQKFLHPRSVDQKIRKSSRGVGGNTALQRCIIVQQTHLDGGHLAQIHSMLCLNTIFICDC